MSLTKQASLKKRLTTFPSVLLNILTDSIVFRLALDYGKFVKQLGRVWYSITTYCRDLFSLISLYVKKCKIYKPIRRDMYYDVYYEMCTSIRKQRTAQKIIYKTNSASYKCKLKSKTSLNWFFVAIYNIHRLYLHITILDKIFIYQKTNIANLIANKNGN